MLAHAAPGQRFVERGARQGNDHRTNAPGKGCIEYSRDPKFVHVSTGFQ
jgi:hypothetical protein